MTTDRLKSTEVLNQIFAWKHNSLAAYITQAEPYIPAGKEPLFAAVREIAAQDREIADSLGRAIEELGQAARIPAYSQSVADLNYLSIDYLASRLLETLKEQASYVQRNIEASPALAGILTALHAQLSKLSPQLSAQSPESR